MYACARGTHVGLAVRRVCYVNVDVRVAGGRQNGASPEKCQPYTMIWVPPYVYRASGKLVKKMHFMVARS